MEHLEGYNEARRNNIKNNSTNVRRGSRYLTGAKTLAYFTQKVNMGQNLGGVEHPMVPHFQNRLQALLTNIRLG
jgi:hypothetical protein